MLDTRLIIFNKNTENFEKEQSKELKEDQSIFSLNTPIEKMMTPYSSYRSPDEFSTLNANGGGFKEFNPAEYLFEIVYDTPYEHQTSQ